MILKCNFLVMIHAKINKESCGKNRTFLEFVVKENHCKDR